MSALRAVWLRPDLVAELLRLTRSALPDEACGALIGSIRDGVGHVTAVIAVPNIAADPRTSYRLDDAHLARLLLTAERDPDQAIIAFWHSHPRGTADPSVEDVRLATWPDIPHVIVGHRHEIASTAAWLLDAGTAAPVPLILSDTIPVPSLVSADAGDRLLLIGAALFTAIMVIAAAFALLPPAPEIPR